MPTQLIADNLDDFLNLAWDLVKEAESSVSGTMHKGYNAILDIVEFDCGGYWTLYVKTAIPALGSALLLILTPSLEEIIESYLEPKPGRRGGRRGRRGERRTGRNRAGQRRIFFGGGIPDVDNAIADRIPGRGYFRGRNPRPGEYIFWTGVRVGDYIAWHWLLVQASVTFATEWQSGLLESGQCKSNAPGSLSFKRAAFSISMGSRFYYSLLECHGVSAQNLDLLNNATANIILSGQYGAGMCVAEAVFTVTKGPQSGVTRLRLGYWITARRGDDSQYVLAEELREFSIGQDQILDFYVSGYHLFNDAKKWEWFYYLEVIENNGLVDVKAQCQVDLNCTSIRDV